MATLERKHVSKWVPTDKTTLMIVLLFTTVVNSCVSRSNHLNDLQLITAQTLGYDSSMMSGLNILPQYKDYFHLNSKTQGLVSHAKPSKNVVLTK